MSYLLRFVICLSALLPLYAEASIPDDFIPAYVVDMNIVQRERIIPSEQNLSAYLSEHVYELSINPPHLLWLYIIGTPEGEDEIERFYGVEGICLTNGRWNLGDGWGGHLGLNLGDDYWVRRYDGKGGISSKFSKDASHWSDVGEQIPLLKGRGLASTILCIPLIKMEGDGWSIGYADEWREYVLSERPVAEALDSDGCLIQEMIVQSPLGEQLRLKWTLAYRDVLGRIYTACWAYFGIALDRNREQSAWCRLLTSTHRFQVLRQVIAASSFAHYLPRHSGATVAISTVMQDLLADLGLNPKLAPAQDIPAFLRIEQSGWQVKWADQSELGEDGLRSTHLELISPKGEGITMVFHLSQIDKDGREWIPAWGIRKQ